MKKIIACFCACVLLCSPFFIGVACGLCTESPDVEEVPTEDISQPIEIRSEEETTLGVVYEDIVTFRAMTETEEDDLIARVVMSEAGNQEMIGKVAVAATILNRAEYFNMSVSAVIYQPNQYANPWEGIVSKECTEAVRIARAERDLFPRTMMYFRTKNYHKYGVPYLQIGSHYFSCAD